MVGECGGGGNTWEDIRPVIVPWFHLQVAARNMAKGSRRTEGVCLTRLSGCFAKGCRRQMPLSCEPK